MGAGASSTYMMTVAALTVAILYLAWRSGQIQIELRGLKTAMDATVSLHEVEEQLLPAIDSLEQEVVSLKRDMHVLKRGGRERPLTEATNNSNTEVFSDAFPDISLLMGMQQLIGGAYTAPGGSVSTSVAGMPTARVLLSTAQSPAPRFEDESEHLQDILSDANSEEEAKGVGVCPSQLDYDDIPEL